MAKENPSPAQTNVRNVQYVVSNLQFIVEQLREDLEEAREQRLGARVSLKHSKASLEQHQNRIKELEEQLTSLTAKVDQARSQNDIYSRRLESLVWHLSQVTGKEINSEYLKEVYEMFEDNKAAKKRRENQESVREAVREQQNREADIPDTVAEIDNTIKEVEDVVEVSLKEEPKPDIEEFGTEDVEEAKEEKTLSSDPVSKPNKPRRIKNAMSGNRTGT